MSSNIGNLSLPSASVAVMWGKVAFRHSQLPLETVVAVFFGGRVEVKGPIHDYSFFLQDQTWNSEREN